MKIPKNRTIELIDVLFFPIGKYSSIWSGLNVDYARLNRTS